MTQRYFEKVPKTYYNNILCRDITRRCKLVADELASPYIFLPYELNHELRSDLIAEYYYEDSELDWAIYLANDIIDPYYGWYITTENFEKFIIDKYGSIETAQKKIAFFRNNWADDPDEISVAYYENNLTSSFKKYYTPILGIGTRIIAYKRKEDDSVMNINRIIEYTISANNAGIPLQSGELVDIKETGAEATVGTGEVEIANSTILRLKNVLNDYTANTSDVKDIIGETSGANVSVNAAMQTFENFSNTEASFWSPVYVYDLETEYNEQKKNLNLLGDDTVIEFVRVFEEKMAEDVDSEGFVVD